MTYEQLPTADLITLESGQHVTPLATLGNEAGGRYHIAEDDHCYVVYCQSVDTGRCTLTTHLFAELFEVLRKMPSPRQVWEEPAREAVPVH